MNLPERMEINNQLVLKHFIIFIITVFFWKCNTLKKRQKSHNLAEYNTLEYKDSLAVLPLKKRQEMALKQAQDSLVMWEKDTVFLDIKPLKKRNLSLMAVGDLMIGTHFPNAAYLPKKEMSMLGALKPYVVDSTLLFGNLEGVILDGKGSPKICNDPKKCYIFKSPTWLAQQYADTGFDVMSTANNHANDFGKTGIVSTQAFLDEVGIKHAGILNQPYTIFKKGQYKIGFTAFAPNTNTQLIHDTKNAIKVVQKLDSLCDIVIVSFHAGGEGKKHQHITRKNEYYYGENRGNVYEFSRIMIDAGADVLIGHGPHVPRAIDLYKNRVIMYSLGNFCTYRRFNLSGVNAYAPAMRVELTTEGHFVKGNIISFIQKNGGIPEVDVSHRAAHKIKQLTIQDFPDTQFVWSGAGTFFPR